MITSDSRGKPGLDAAMKRFADEHLQNKVRLHMTNCGDLTLDQFIDMPQKSDHKPHGMWYGIGDSWVDWCLSEMSGWISPFLYEIVPNDEHLLTISTVPDFEKFEDEHNDVPEWQKDRGMIGLEGLLSDVAKIRIEQFRAKTRGGRRSMLMYYNMNYGKVAEKYGGMEITPYFYNKRLESVWYYGWDCASGCIWNRSAIKSLRLFAHYDERSDEFVKTALQPDKIGV